MTMSVVIKVGTSSLINAEHNSLNLGNLARLCEVVRDLHARGLHIIIVSSGAVGVGCIKLGVERPSAIPQRQALAAVGQVHLMRYYEDFLSSLGLTCAQVLLTLDNLANRGQYLNARSTFQALHAMRTVPIVNENDTVAVEELRFGDNDTLSAQVATLVEADWLFLLTDVDCLFTANPASDPAAAPIPEVHNIADLQVDTSTKGTSWGTGGMATKLTAARLATAAGCHMVICSSSKPEVITAVLDGQRQGTVFYPHPHALRGRKRWVLAVPVRGSVWLDEGAVRAVRDRQKSLFSAGIVKVAGDFAAQEAVGLCDAEGVEFARGLSNYRHDEVAHLQGHSSSMCCELLGYQGSEEVVNRNNICLLIQRRYFSDAMPEVDEDRKLNHEAAGGVKTLSPRDLNHEQQHARATADAAVSAVQALAPGTAGIQTAARPAQRGLDMQPARTEAPQQGVQWSGLG